MNYENVVCIPNGVLVCHKEERNYVVCRYMDGIGYHVKYSKPGSKGPRCHVFPHMWKLNLEHKSINKYIHD
jgi:hypothetical protein